MTLTEQRRRPRSEQSSAAPPNQPLLVALLWIRAHCVVPDGFRRGAPFTPYGWQNEFLSHHYLVRGDAVWNPDSPLTGSAFVYRRSMIVGPQKMGKDPMVATQVCLEGDGPALFGGWAGKDEGYVCADYGCGCGWEYPYDVGEPKGMRWPTTRIQITSVSEEATENTYLALRPMIELGPLADRIPKTGEEFIRLPSGRIDTVTASANSRLGQPISFTTQGEVGIWTKTNGMEKVADTQYRNLAGMGGRASLNTNAWDPAERSVGQTQYESPSQDIYRQFLRPPSGLSMKVKDERRRILRTVYPMDTWRENGGHVDLDAIDAEATDLVSRDPAQAARFFGNQLVTGSGKAFDLDVWGKLADPDHVVPKQAQIVAGFDGSRTDDHTALVATEVSTGHQWPVHIWNPADFGGEVPRDQVDAAVDDLFATYKVLRLNADPPYWKEEIAAWSGRYGDEIVKEWATYRNRLMGFAVREFAAAISTGQLKHSGDATFSLHIGNAHRKELNERDDKGVRLWTLQKERDGAPDKIDAAVAAVLSWEARTVVIAEGALNQKARFGAFVA